MKRKAFTFIEFVVVLSVFGILFILVLPTGIVFPFQAGFYLLFGWIFGVCRLLFTLKYELLIGLGMLFLASLVLHGVIHLVYFYDRKKEKWTLKRSIAVTGLLCSLLIAAVALGFGDNEMYRISRSEEFWLLSSNAESRNFSSQNNLKQFGVGAHNFSDNDTTQSFPTGGTFLSDGQPGHGWLTLLMPYIELTLIYKELDLEKPWDDPINAPVYKERLWSLDCPKYGGETDANGFHLTYYAANERVMPLGRSLGRDEITDGTTNTILCGEVAKNPQPCGSPFNGRDPVLGVNRSEYGFGYKKPYNTVNFAMCDGSVRQVSDKIAPEILRAMATPNGGEPLDLDKELMP